MIEYHPMEPLLPPHAKVLLLGSFPPPRSRWSMNFFYPNFLNDMWRIMGLIFFDNPLHFVTGKKFNEVLVRQFCEEKGIALYDTAQAVIRQNNNASDKFLEVVTPLDLASLLVRIPECTTIATTGQKATETLLSVLQDFNLQAGEKQKKHDVLRQPAAFKQHEAFKQPESIIQPKFLLAPGSFVTFQFQQRFIRLYRMPSSSRAYPKPLKEKAAEYLKLFCPK